MPASEIDDIFASKGRHSLSAPSRASSSSLLLSEKKKKKKKDKGKDKAEVETKPAKRKRDEADGDAAPAKPPKRQVPETVFDPSVGLSSAPKAKSAKTDKISSTAVKPKKPKKDREEEERFKDSRGTGPRRKTEEGFLIYKEDELGISEQGGDTPLCPFDCQCCF